MIDKGLYRQNFKGGGMDMGASSSKSSGPAGGASRGGNYGGNVNTSQPSFGGGDRDRPAPPSVPSTDRMDIREQARLGNINPNQDNFVTVQGVDRRALDPGSAQNVTRTVLDRFTSYRPEVNIPGFGILGLIGNALKPGIQKFADITAAENRGFFGDPNYTFSPFGINLGKFGEKKNVIQAGKYQLPGELGIKYGKLGYEDISSMTPEELEQAYQSYMSSRMANEIDAYGNPLIRGGGEGIASIPQYIIPKTGPKLGVEPETEMSFYETLRKNLGLV